MDCLDVPEEVEDSTDNFDGEPHQIVMFEAMEIGGARLSSGGCSGLRLWYSAGGTYVRYFSDGPRLGYNSSPWFGKLSDSSNFYGENFIVLKKFQLQENGNHLRRIQTFFRNYFQTKF